MRARRSVTLTPTGMSVAQLEVGDRLARAAHVGLLAGDRGELLLGRLEHLRVLLGVAHAHVQRDLLDARDLHRARVAEALLELRVDLLLVALLEARRDVGLCRWLPCLVDVRPDFLAKRTRRAALVALDPDAASGRRSWGPAASRWTRGSGPGASMMPPELLRALGVAQACAGRWWRFWMFRPSTTTLCFLGSTRSTRPVLPRSLPEITLTMSSRRIFMAQSTSGASETIFMKLRSRSSRATGPKMRVPRGLLVASISTAAFSSNAM